MQSNFVSSRTGYAAADSCRAFSAEDSDRI